MHTYVLYIDVSPCVENTHHATFVLLSGRLNTSM